jgi:DNA polymerase elongation subunit (family B)
MPMKIPLTNIANKGRDIYLFLRDSTGNLDIKVVNDFFPFFYEPDEEGQFISYGGQKLRKVYVSVPHDVVNTRSFESFSSDIKFTNNFLIHKIETILPSQLKYCFLDIEVLAADLPETTNPKYPVSCISIYNSYTKRIYTWYLGDFPGTIKEAEKALLEKFIEHMQKEKYDMWLSWNVAFDYNYLYGRIPQFAKKISPIGSTTVGEDREIFYPAGISIIDYMKWFKKIYMREQSYALDNVAQKHLKEEHWERTDFSQLNPLIKAKNINDIKRMVALEEQKQIIPYFDELRRMVKCNFVDLYYNSRIVEALLFDEAKRKNIVLPNKPDVNEEDEDTTFEGAVRNVENPGLFFDIGWSDLSSAYPSMIINFCLDTQNVVEDEAEFEMEGGTPINGIYFKQNKDALLPTIIKKILTTKDKLKKLKKENPQDKNIAMKYDAIKAVVNSFFGVTGNRYFRLFDNRIASTIAFLVRDVLMYVRERVEKEGLKVIYYDTDSLMINQKEDITGKLNQYIKDWAKEKYNKNDIDLTFSYEGYFKSLFILATCHYVGVLSNGTKEIKGVEMKRASSSKFEAMFQEALIDKILDKGDRETILKWLELEKEKIPTLPLKEIGFPCKVSNREYKGEPIFIRAYNNSKSLFNNFKVSKGELFYYTFIKSFGKDRNGKDIDVIAFENKLDDDRIKIDYEKVIDRSINYKTKKIFEAMGWFLPDNALQLSLY